MVKRLYKCKATKTFAIFIFEARIILSDISNSTILVLRLNLKPDRLIGGIELSKKYTIISNNFPYQGK